MRENLQDFQSRHEISELIQFDGKIHRYKKYGNKSKSAWYIAFSNTFEGREYQYIVVGDWREDGVKHTWQSFDGHEFVDEFKAQIKEIQEKEKEEKKVTHAEAKKSANAIWEASKDYDPSTHAYMEAKGLNKTYGSRYYDGTKAKYIVIPRRNTSGEILSLQKIFEDGKKLFHKGGKVIGTYFMINEAKKPKRIFICEGFATGGSCSEVIKDPIAVAFNSGNLEPVYLALRDLYPTTQFVVLADNDKFKKFNTGLDKAHSLYLKHGVKYFFPEFASSESEPTDFNDLAQLEGLDAIKSSMFMRPTRQSKSYKDFKDWFSYKYRDVRLCPMTNTAYYKNKFKEWAPIENIINVLKSEASRVSINPATVEQHLYGYINELDHKFLFDMPEYDGGDHISDMVDMLEFKNVTKEQGKELFKEWCAGVFARSRNAYNQNKVIIFQGGQGIGKDRFLHHMFKGLDMYFSDIPVSEKLKEMVGDTSNLLIGNIPEFDETHKQSVSTLKTLITSPKLNYRDPYARKGTLKAMRTSFISSCNLESILRDSTGNRRYVILEVSKIKWEYDHIDPMQIMAQMKHLDENRYKASNETLKIMGEYIEENTPENTDDEILEDVDERISRLLASKQTSMLRYDDIASFIVEVSKNHGVGIKRVKSVISRKNMRRTMNARYYTTSDRRNINLVSSNDSNDSN